MARDRRRLQIFVAIVGALGLAGLGAVTSLAAAVEPNDPPVGTDKTVTTPEDTTYAFAVSDFGFSDPNDVPADDLNRVKVTTLPGAGTLELNGAAVSAGAFVTKAQLDNGDLVFIPEANANGWSYASFTFQVEDDGGTANGGAALDPSPNAMTIDVTAVNDAPTAAAPEGIPGVGVQFHAMWSDYTDAQRLDVVDKMADAGLEWFRIDFGWSSIQPQNGTSYAQWYFDRADLVINAARARGMKVLLTFWRTPDWANGGNGPYAPPTDFEAYGRAARYTANYFRGRVAAYEVWNEPNLIGHFWSGTIADYTSLLRASYDDFHAGDPNAKVVAGTVAYNDDAWLRQMYENGAEGYFDVISTHPYQGIADQPPEAPDNGTKWLSHVPAVHELMEQYGDGDKPIWFTEFGWSNHENYDGLGNGQQGVTAQQQSDYFVRAIKYVYQNFPYVKNMFWYNERNRASGNIQFDNYGLLYRSLSPKPVYDRIKTYLATPDRTTTPTPEDTTHAFAAPDFGFSDPNDVPADAFNRVKVTTLPSAGALELNGAAVSAGAFVTKAQLDNGDLVFIPEANANGWSYARFAFQVEDDGGTANGGAALDPSPNAMTIDVTAVNDPPVIQGLSSKEVPENQELAFSVSAIDPDDVVTYSATDLPAGASLDASTGAFTWTPTYDQAGTYDVTFKAEDPDGLFDEEVVTITVVEYKPDGLIKLGSGNFIGNGVYNTTGANQTRSTTATLSQTKTFTVRAENDGTTIDSIRLRGPGSSARWSVTYLFEGTNVTSQAIDGTFTLEDLAPGVGEDVTLKIKPKSTAIIGSSKAVLVTAESLGDGTAKDAIKAKVTVTS
jgi:hypothetical protein